MIVNIAVLNVSFTTSCLTNRKFSPWTYTVLIKDALYLTTIIKLPYIPFFPLNFITVITILGNFEQLVIRDAYECIDSPKIRSFTIYFHSHNRNRISCQSHVSLSVCLNTVPCVSRCQITSILLFFVFTFPLNVVAMYGFLSVDFDMIYFLCALIPLDTVLSFEVWDSVCWMNGIHSKLHFE